MVTKIPTETNSFQAVLLPLHPSRFPHQMDESTCWQIGCATNCGENREGERYILDRVFLIVSVCSYLLLVVVNSKPQSWQVGYPLLEGLLIQGILALVSAAVENRGHLALVATHAHQLNCKILTELLQVQVLRLQERGTTAKVKQQQTRVEHKAGMSRIVVTPWTRALSARACGALCWDWTRWAWRRRRWRTRRLGWRFRGRCWCETRRTSAGRTDARYDTPDRRRRSCVATGWCGLLGWAWSLCHTGLSGRLRSEGSHRGQTGSCQWSGQRWPERRSARPSCCLSLGLAGPTEASPLWAGWCPRRPAEPRESDGSRTWPPAGGWPWHSRCPGGWTGWGPLSTGGPRTLPAGGRCRLRSSAVHTSARSSPPEWHRWAPGGTATSCS